MEAAAPVWRAEGEGEEASVPENVADLVEEYRAEVGDRPQE